MPRKPRVVVGSTSIDLTTFTDQFPKRARFDKEWRTRARPRAERAEEASEH